MKGPLGWKMQAWLEFLHSNFRGGDVTRYDRLPGPLEVRRRSMVFRCDWILVLLAVEAYPSCSAMGGYVTSGALNGLES